MAQRWLCLLLIVSCLSSSTRSNNKANRLKGKGSYHMATTGQLLWSDEFKQEGTPDASKWKYDVGGHGWGNNELQHYTPANARVQTEGLVIEAKKQEIEDRQYSSARVLSVASWKPPIIVEVRARVPTGRGIWPAIWMLPDNWHYGEWPRSGEIDIMEHVGHHDQVVFGSVHTESFNHLKGTQVTKTVNVSDLDEWHTYRCEWSEQTIKLSIDNQLPYFVYENKGNWQDWPFDQPFRVLLNVAVGGNWGGAKGVDDSIFPKSLIVQSVKVWELISNSPVQISTQVIPVGSATLALSSDLELLLCARGGEVVMARAHENLEHLWQVSRAGDVVYLQMIGSRLWLGCTNDGQVGVSEERQPWTFRGSALYSSQGRALTAYTSGAVRAVGEEKEEGNVRVHLSAMATSIASTSSSSSSSSTVASPSFINWQLVPKTASVLSGPVLILSVAHLRYLSSTSEGVVSLSTTPHYWEFRKVEGTEKFFVRSLSTNRFLGSTPESAVDTTFVQQGWQHWEIEAATAIREIFVRSSDHRSVLGAIPEGMVSTTYVTQLWQHWRLL